MPAVRTTLFALVLGPILLVVAAAGGCEARKAYYDWQLRNMCEKDGGVSISERLQIDPSQVVHLPTVDGHVGVAPEALSDPAAPAFGRLKQQVLRRGHQSLMRYEEEIVRRADGRIIARVVTYTRAGGDFPSFAHPSLYSCPPATPYSEIERVFELVSAKP